MSVLMEPSVRAETLPATAPRAAPTTKVLAVGAATAKGTPDAIASVLPAEVRATVRAYLAGEIEQWFFQSEGAGAVFVMNATSPAAARAILDALPLCQAGMVTFELTALGPLQPLAVLLDEPA